MYMRFTVYIISKLYEKEYNENLGCGIFPSLLLFWFILKSLGKGWVGKKFLKVEKP